MQRTQIKDVIRYELIGMIVILVGFTIFDLVPNLKTVYRYSVKNKIEIKAADMRRQRETVDKKQSYQQNVSSLKENLETLKKALAKVETKVIREKNLPLIVLQIEDIAADLPIEVVSMKPQEIEVLGNYELQPVEIRFKGEYASLTAFIERLEGTASVVSVYDVSIDKDMLVYPKLDAHLVALVLFEHQPEKQDEVF